ncbi:capsule assembly Wzi family protein [Gracilimonas mengyeensis]|uniref:capsule assembly Wzi family protein n=1 Tax=Gracilimonas mengyeensis TaxID=1302730 RepID=UPI00115AE602|nr:capsule assembly Wzi family protein [Gracilimonas mengyeensis]
MAQWHSPDSISAGLYTSVSKKEYQPFWLAANRQGFIEEFSQGNAVFRMQAHSSFQSYNIFEYAYGIDVAARAAEVNSDLYFHQLYGSLKASIFQLDAGWKYYTVGEPPSKLSSGSMGISNNSRTIPRINLSIPKFTPVPLTYSFIQFKGNLAHGWLGNDRSTKGAYLHEKTFYLQGGFDYWPVQGYAGMVHFAQWGGTMPDGEELPSGFEDFTSVFFGSGGGSDAPDGEQVNALGNHLGIWDFGMEIELKNITLNLYYQHPFEDKSQLRFSREEDGLYGINVESKKQNILSGFLWEFIYTKAQTGPGLSDPVANFPYCEEENCGYPYGGRDNYYNNYIYEDGWTNQNRTLGTPLFLSVAQLKSYFPDAKVYNTAIESNRIVGHHMGLEGYISPRFKYRALVTYVRHYGNYHGINGGYGQFNSKNPEYDKTQYLFYPALEQWNFLVETEYSFPRLSNIHFITSLAYDNGDLNQNLGLLLGATYHF